MLRMYFHVKLMHIKFQIPSLRVNKFPCRIKKKMRKRETKYNSHINILLEIKQTKKYFVFKINNKLFHKYLNNK